MVKHLRSAMAAIDKIAESDQSNTDRDEALARIQRYTLTVRSRLLTEDQPAESA